MAWSITRRATDEDVELLEKRAKAFINRHEFDMCDADSGTYVYDLENELEFLVETDYDNTGDGKYLWGLWKRIANRAIGDDGIAHGCIGHSVEG